MAKRSFGRGARSTRANLARSSATTSSARRAPAGDLEHAGRRRRSPPRRPRRGPGRACPGRTGISRSVRSHAAWGSTLAGRSTIRLRARRGAVQLGGGQGPPEARPFGGHRDAALQRHSQHHRIGRHAARRPARGERRRARSAHSWSAGQLRDHGQGSTGTTRPPSRLDARAAASSAVHHHASARLDRRDLRRPSRRPGTRRRPHQTSRDAASRRRGAAGRSTAASAPVRRDCQTMVSSCSCSTPAVPLTSAQFRRASRRPRSRRCPPWPRGTSPGGSPCPPRRTPDGGASPDRR